jgi:hypothetical protein
VRIALRKVSDERHVLEIVRDGGRVEAIACETRSYLRHDLLHYAAESLAGVDGGFWGTLARGVSLAEVNDRSAYAAAPATPELLAMERIVGILSGAVKGRSAAQIVAGFQSHADALGWSTPAWLTADFVAAVQERMRQLHGRWKATPYGQAMELTWPDRAQPLAAKPPAGQPD